MFGFLGFLLIIFLLIVFIGFTILGNIPLLQIDVLIRRETEKKSLMRMRESM